MRYSKQIKPISYLKANAAKMLDTIADTRQPVVITQNGEARAVLQDVGSYERTQETLVLLKILALGQREIDEGRTVPARAAVAMRKGRRER
jgi:prevent-host-death family protein